MTTFPATAQSITSQPPQGPIANSALHRVGRTVTRTGIAIPTKPTCMNAVDAIGVDRHGPSTPAVMDVHAYDRALADHSDALYRFAVHHLRDRDEAKDIVQESYLRLWMRLDKVAMTGARSYLFTTAHHLIVDRSRRRRNMTRYDAWHENIRTTHQPAAGLKDRIDDALAKLNPLQRSLILLRELDGHSYQDIATITGLDMTKVKVYLFRARKAMQAHLGDPAALI